MSRPLEGRNGEIWRAYLLGTTQEELALLHGVSQPRISEIVCAARAAIPDTNLAEAKTEYLDTLRTLAQKAASLMDLPPAPAYSNGRPMLNDDGTPVLDYGTQMQALDRVVKIGERVSKVLGLDAPVKADVTVNEQAQRLAEAAAGEAVAHLLTEE